MRLGLAQMDIQWEAIEDNKKKVISFLEEAREKEVQWIVFPEMTMTGFSMNTSMAVYYEDIKEFFRKSAKEYQIGIVYGIIAQGDEGKFENRMIIVDEKGREGMEYSKIHPFSYGAESQYYTGGDKVFTYAWNDMVFSGFICYDLRFPTIFQAVSENAKVIYVIANWPDARIDQWDALLAARAIENCCYVVGVNRAGKAGRLNYVGHSAVYDYVGHNISGVYEGEELIVADIDVSKVDEYRSVFPAVQDRRPEVYRNL